MDMTKEHLRRRPASHRTAPRLLAAAMLALAAAAPAPAQQQLPGVFGEIIDVRVVNIEVVVTDRHGDRVSGLGAGDFRLLVDGKEVPIDYFTEVQGGVAVEPGKAAPEAPQGLPALAAGKAVGTSYLVFIDDFFSIERDRNRVIDQLREQLPLLGPEDRMAVVSFDGRRLDMLSTWSQSQSGLERALKEASRRPALGLARLSEYRQVATNRGLDVFQNASPLGPEIGYRLTPDERHYVDQLDDQIDRQVAAAAATLRSFAMPPGRKVLVLLSGGWPFDPAQYAAADQSIPVLDTDVKRGGDLFRPLADTANLLGYTVYPVDVPGLQGSGVDASVATVSPPGSPGVQSPEQELHTSLGYIAERTGGRALLNSLRGNALSAAATDTRSYYWLGFTPTRERDDKRHRIEVKVDKPGLKVRSREGFLDFSRQAEVTAMVESTLLFGNPPGSGALPVKVGTIKPLGRNRIEAPLSVAIPVDDITLLPEGDHFVAELELRIAVLDENGNQAEIPVIPLHLKGDKQPTPGGHIRYDTTLKLRRQKHELVVAVYDPASGRIVSNRVVVNP
jgi:VWFA-related protein